MTTAEFIRRAKAVHGERFDYGAAAYRGFTAPLTLGCRLHGTFSTTPKSHLHSKAGGCRPCIERALRPDTLQRQQDAFLRKARLVHGNRYEYGPGVSEDGRCWVTVVCAKHGPFLLRRAKHLRGHGCRQCSHARLSQERRLSVWELIDRIAAAQGLGRYDYNLRGYVNLHSRLAVRCHKHGWFVQMASAHIKGHGCAKCCSSRGERRIRRVLRQLGHDFVEQARFPECRDRRPLPFDFYLPHIRTLIEYDGKQHYRKSELWGGHHQLERTQRHDAIRNQFATEHGYRLLRIPYWQFDQIEEILRRDLTPAHVAPET
jgi:hypothetical protein